MPDIREYDELDQLEDWIISNYEGIKENIATVSPFTEEQIEQLELDEILIGGEWGRGTPRDTQDVLNIGLVISIEGQPTSDADIFQQLAGSISEALSDSSVMEDLPNVETPTESMAENFGGINTITIPSNEFVEGINLLVPTIREEDPNRVYSLSRDQNINILENRLPEREAAGVRTDEEVTEDVVGEPSDIIDFPEKENLIERIQTSFQIAKEQEIEDSPDRQELVQSLSIDNIVFMGEWGSGNAEYGVDPFEITVFVDSDDRDLSVAALFNRVSRNIQDNMIEVFQPSDLIKQWAGGIDITVLGVDNFESSVQASIDDPEADKAYSLLDNTILRLEPRETVGFELSEEPIVDEGIDEEPEEDLTDVEPPEEDIPEEPEPEEPEEEEPEEPEFPGVPVELRQFAVSEDKVEIPAGKETKSLTPRPIYDFEKAMIAEGIRFDDLPDISEGIGTSIGSQRFGNEDAPGSFPRTGVYIKNRLFYEGPAHILGLYNDLVVYTGYVNAIHRTNIKAGKYPAMREYIYRIREIEERGGPSLIEPLTQQQSASRGLSVTPTLPDGTEAPWLENKQFYDVVEDNMEHPAWTDIVGYLKEEVEQQG